MLLRSYWNKFKYLMGNTIYRMFKPVPADSLALNCWVLADRGGIKCRTFGDELNIYLLQGLTDRHIHIYNSFFHKKRDNYMAIGSLIDGFTDSQSIIWGSGLISDKAALPARPKQVCAVRGKLTRDYLLRNGVECPEVYGDPALLTPLIYKPTLQKKYKIGIIPHVKDLQDDVVAEFVRHNQGAVHLVDFAHYQDWHDVIDTICSCEYIVSTSLHGLILSDAYGVPNLWARISDRVKGGDCKFMDYFSAVGRTTQKPFALTANTQAQEIITMLSSYQEIQFDPLPLLRACPFQLKEEIRIRYRITES